MPSFCQVPRASTIRRCTSEVTRASSVMVEPKISNQVFTGSCGAIRAVYGGDCIVGHVATFVFVQGKCIGCCDSFDRVQEMFQVVSRVGNEYGVVGVEDFGEGGRPERVRVVLGGKLLV